MTITAAIFWLMVGVFCFTLEGIGLTGVGLFFAGLGALSLALLMQTGMPAEAAYIAQGAWFFGFTVVWAAILWKPIKHYRMRRRSSDYSNMIGDRATVEGEPLAKGRDGRVKWSGTLMIAEIAQDSVVQEIAAGEAVVIKGVKGNRLYVDTQ